MKDLDENGVDISAARNATAAKKNLEEVAKMLEKEEKKEEKVEAPKK
jgi:hypothetical protein